MSPETVYPRKRGCCATRLVNAVRSQIKFRYIPDILTRNGHSSRLASLDTFKASALAF